MRFLPSISLLFLTFLIFLSTNRTEAQNQNNNYGKEFRFTFLENYGSLDKVSFVVSLTKLPDTVRIYAGNSAFETIVYKNYDTVLNYTKFSSPNAIVFGPNKSILINTKSNTPFALYAMNNVQNSSDISTITPSEKIPGNPDYFINTYRGDESLGKENNSLFSVVAIDDSCYINVMPSADSKYNLVKNVPFGIWLRKGQVYFEQALDSQSFAGTHVWNSNGCKRFAVFEGAKCSFVDYSTPNCRGCDHLYNQTRPLQYLGKSFTTLPYETIDGGYIYQIVATENNTNIKIDGVFRVNLNKAEVYQYNQKTNVVICIESDKLISVVELMKSGECNGQIDKLGNPSLMNVVPNNQTTTNTGFSFPFTTKISQNPISPADFYVGISAPIGSLYKIRINGNPIDTSKFKNSCQNSVGSIKLNPALKYKISSEIGFIAYMYAFGIDESYASEIGSSFENSKTQISLDANQYTTCDSFNVFRFKAKSDSFALYKWSFGDGTFQNGDSVSKKYPKTGVYQVKLNATYPNNVGCLGDTFVKTVKVQKRPYFNLGRDSILCFGDFFQVSPVVEPKAKYLWSNGSTSSLIVVNNAQKVWLKLTDTNQCSYTDTMNLSFANCDTNSIIIPNVFTPSNLSSQSNDNINDLFETKFTGFDELKGKIYNRWGNLVYSFSFPTDAYWNGGLNNDVTNPCPSGTYYYFFEFTNSKTNLVRSYNGVVELIR
jgi:gliding motility-associated-like protein